jgi:hypothetical protein
MCSMCAAAAVAAASGTRSWLATQSWLTPRLLRVVTISLAVVALAVSSVRFSGSSQPTPHHATPPAPVAQR